MNKNKKITLESMLPVTITFMLIMTISVAYSYYNGKIFRKIDEEKITTKYTNILMSIREDALMSAKAEIMQNRLRLLNKDGKIIANYTFANGKLTRDIENKEVQPKLLLANVKEANFWINSKLPNLLSVSLLTNNESDPPFFTSFALRCYSNE